MAEHGEIRVMWETAVKQVLNELATEGVPSRAKDLAEAYAALASQPARYDD